MSNFLTALQFLTIIPVKSRSRKQDFGLSLIYFPAVGILIGLILVALNRLFIFINLPFQLSNLLLVVSSIVITGSLHLDGLSDTFDALACGKEKDEALKVMRDSRVGVFGAISLICLILIKVMALNVLTGALKELTLITMCLLSRFYLVFAIYLFPYLRQAGRGKIFSQQIKLKAVFLAGLLTIGSLAVLFELIGLGLLVVCALITIMLGRFFTNKFGGITGDILGAINEFIEVSVLLIVVILVT